MVSATRSQTQARVQQRLQTEPGKPSWRRRHRVENDEASKQFYLDALPKLVTSSLALKAAGATPYQLAVWRESDAAFLVAERYAREAIADQLEAEAVRRAFRGVKRPVYQGGLLAGYLTEYSDQLLMFVLRAMRPERFRERSEVTVTPIVKTVAGFEAGDVL